jgi:hypothetical protein
VSFTELRGQRLREVGAKDAEVPERCDHQHETTGGQERPKR